MNKDVAVISFVSEINYDYHDPTRQDPTLAQVENFVLEWTSLPEAQVYKLRQWCAWKTLRSENVRINNVEYRARYFVIERFNLSDPSTLSDMFEEMATAMAEEEAEQKKQAKERKEKQERRSANAKLALKKKQYTTSLRAIAQLPISEEEKEVLRGKLEKPDV